MNNGKKSGEKRPIPGEISARLLHLRNEYLPKGVGQVTPLFIEKAKGALLKDVDGNEYIDFTCGIAAIVTGHCNDKIDSVIKEQSDKHLHLAFQVVMYESYVMLAKKLAEITPGDFPKKVFFANAGCEAIENAVKTARTYTGRHGLIAFERAFHGRTALAAALTGRVKPFKFGFGLCDSGIYRFPYPYTYRAPFKTTDNEYGEYCVKRIEDSLKGPYASIAPEEVAAIVVEPFLGEGGYIIPPAGFMQGLRRICDEYGIILIVDEIQSGMGRTGKMWAIEHFDVVPDILVAGKALGGGLIISAHIGKADIMDSVGKGGIGGTFGGHPLSCVAGLKTIEIIEKENLLDRATQLGRITKDRLENMKEKYNIIGDVRGIGCSIGIEFVKDRKTKEPAPEETAEICAKSLERGLIIEEVENIFRILFPLEITEEQLETGLDIMEYAIMEVNKTAS